MRAATPSAPPFTGLKVIDLADDVAGEYEARLLAEMGADVVKVEPPGGARSRRIGPFAEGRSGPDDSLAFWYYNSNKRSVVLDIEAPGDRSAFDRLVASADIVVITLQPARLKALGLDLKAMVDRHPRLIVVSVTPFGLTGPWADYKSSDLVGLALGGPLNSCGYDDHSIPPIRPGGDQAYHTAASFAHIGVMLALIERQNTGKGQLVDVSMHDGCAVNVELANPYWFYPKVHVHRQTCRHAQPSPTQSALFRTADDRFVYFTLILSDRKLWQAFVAWMEEKGMAAQLVEPAFLDLAYRQARFPEIQALAECFFLIMDAETAYREGQAAGLPIGVLNAPEDLLHDEHLRARGFFVEVEHEGRGPVLYPGAGYRFSAFAEVRRTSAPKLGEHSRQVLAGLAEARARGGGGMIDDDLAFVGRDKCAVAGVGQTEFSRDSGRSVLSLATEASLKAIADAGLSAEDVDGIVRCGDDAVTPYTLAASLGAVDLRYWADTGPGGVAPCMMMGLAMGAVLSGQAKVVLCFRSLNGRSESRLGSGGRRAGAQVVGGFGAYDEFFLPYGLMTAGQTFALMARRYMLEYGATAEHLGAVALACRENAQSTPHAVMHGRPMNMDDYLASRMISTPLRLLDFCLETDGACAVIVTAAERAKDLPRPPVLIRAVAGGAPRDHRGGMMFPVITRDMTELGGRQAGAELWRRAGLGPGEMDIAQIYDCFTISVILQLEAYGFCGKGEGGPFAASGAIRKGGALPINNGGGHMSEGYVHGMNHVVQAVRQLRGDADNQIEGAELCLCTGGPLPVGSSVVFRKAA